MNARAHRGRGLLVAGLVVAACGGSLATASAQQTVDVQAPEYALGGLRDPAQGVLVLTVSARDTGGSGLLSATASLGGATPVVARFGDETCATQTPAACPEVGTVELEVPTTSHPDGPHNLDFHVNDAAGNVSATVERVITVRNTPAVYASTVTVHVGTGVAIPPAPSSAGAGARPGSVAPTCQSPRLRVALTRKPLRRMRSGVPVLVAGKSYRFSGGLTCMVGTRRVNAPRGVPIDVYHHFGRRVVRKPSAKTQLKGRVVVNQRLYGSRVIVFRVGGKRREVVAVRIRVAVIRR